MSLNIKNPRVHALARQLSEQTGRSQTSVIEEALTRMVAELEPPTHDATRRRSIDAVLADIDRRVTDDDRSRVHRLELFDDRGLPA